MRRTAGSTLFCSLLLLLFAAGAARAELPDPEALAREIAAARLEPAAAVSLKGLKLSAGLATVSLVDGVLVPASAVGGRPIEMVFLGKGRIVLDPPDEVEAGQLELFTGGQRLDEEFEAAVLVIGLDAASEAIERRPKVAALDPALARRAEEVYAAVALQLASDLQVSRVTDGAGAPLTYHRTGRDLDVLLPRPAAEGETVTLVVEYAGKLVEKQGGSFALLDTLEWYPHAGSVDRAPYEATFRWPRKLDLVACGRRVDGGEQGDVKWERRALDLPAAGFTFEIGRFREETARAGHVEVTLAFDPEGSRLGKDVRQEIAQAVTGSLSYFEELFGPYPLDTLTVVTGPRDFSQALPGFVSLSDFMMVDFGIWNLLLGFEDRRTVVAHEIAHQWWGHRVGWASYRDQWISEAMANYAALLYGRQRLDWKGRLTTGPTTGWQEALTSTMPDGRTVESLGPVVLGDRLFSSRGGDAYQPIVYKKGAVILDMLARTYGEESFPKILARIVQAADNGVLSTEDFLSLIERVTGSDLDWFAERYVYGTGLPEVYYSYQFEPAGEGKWKVVGQARQQTPYRFRYRLVKAAAGGLDVTRERVDQIELGKSRLVVPVEIAVHDASRPAEKKGKKAETAANATILGRMLLTGPTTPLAITVEHEPKELWLDRKEEVFGRFFNESRNPKRVLYYQGIDATAAGQAAEAEALYARALAAPVEVIPEGEKGRQGELKREGRELDARIELGRARLYLEQGRDAEAQAAFERAHRVLGTYGGWIEEELKVVESRLDIRRGDFDRAFKRLRKGLLARGSIDSTEGYLLLAIAAKATGHGEELEQALKAAREGGVDVALLAGGG